MLALAVEAAATLKDARQALSLADELLAKHPGSPLVDGMLARAAAIATAGGDSLRAAHYRLLDYDRDPVRGQRDDGVPRCATLVERLSAGQLPTSSCSIPAARWFRTCSASACAACWRPAASRTRGR